MQILKEDENELIFVAHPNTTLDRGTLLRTMILMLTAVLVGIFYFRRLRLSDVAFVVIAWTLVFGCFFVYGKLSIVKVTVDKRSNQLTVLGLTASSMTFNFPWNYEPVEIPLHLINKMDYIYWATGLNTNSPILNRGKLIFDLRDKSKVTFYTWGLLASYENYGDIGRKIAEYIGVPFNM